MIIDKLAEPDVVKRLALIMRGPHQVGPLTMRSVVADAMAEIERLRAALKVIADPHNTRPDALGATVREFQRLAAAALEQKADNAQT